MRRLIVLALLAVCCAAIAAEDKKASPPSAKGKPAYTLVPSDYNPFAPVKPLTPSQVFDKVKDSVVVVKAIGADGKIVGLGSGVLLPAGKIGTNCHVLKGGVRFQVGGSRKFVAATLWGSDEDKDICLLEAKGLSANPAQLGQAGRLKVGEAVYAVGAPRGLELSLSEGIVSQLRGGPPPYIQTTAAISPGSSGGGLFDDQARLIGITTFYLADGQNLNFAVPADLIAQVSKKELSNGKGTKERSDSSWISIARRLESRGSWDELRSLSVARTRTHPRDVEAWSVLASANFSLKKYDEALAAAKTALDLDREHWLTWFVLGAIYTDAIPIRVDDAIGAFRETLRLKPDHVQSMVQLAWVYGFNNQPNLALDILARAATLEPDNGDVWSQMGRCLLAVSRATDAIKSYKRAVAVSPGLWSAWVGLGQAYRTTGQYPLAIEAFREALRLDGSNAYLWKDLVDLYIENCQLAEARPIAERLTKDHPNDGYIGSGRGLEASIRERVGYCETKKINDLLRR